MKKLILVFAISLGVFSLVQAQLIKRAEVEQKFTPLNWHELSYDRDSVYGMELDKAYEFLKGKEKKQKVVVAVIDGGFDVQHEDLKEMLWTNPGEIAGNRTDDDGNGYVDDVHGWNFLVGKDGKIVVHTMDEAAKLFLQKKDRYEALSAKTRNKKEEQEFRNLRQLMQRSELGKKYLSVWVAKKMKEHVEGFDRKMRTEFPGEELTCEHFDKVLTMKGETDTIKMTAHMIYKFMWKQQPEAKWENIFAKRLESVRMAEKEYEQLLAKQKDERAGLGDNPDNLRDRYYGSGELLTENADHGTHVAGIIGARRGNDIGMDGIADQVQLMLIRAVPEGDENDKDVALAIYYAVDHGAQIINMSFGKRASLHQDFVSKALRYAEKKGVLMVHGAGNSFENIDRETFYPTKHVSPKKAISTFITVGASDAAGNPAVVSNYGRREVDVFAPGVKIYSTVAGSNYKKMGGTSMACPMVSGVAALLMTYYPELTASEVKDILIRTADTRRGANVPKPHEPMLLTRERISFTDLCVSGGIVNAYKAVRLAEQMVAEKHQ